VALSDCEKCWNTPCTCGWGYRNYTKEARLKLAASILGIQSDQLTDLLAENTPETHPITETLNLEK